MRTTITAFAVALTMTAAAQPQRILEALGEPMTTNILEKKMWYVMKTGDCAMSFGITPIGIKAAMDYEVYLMGRLKDYYVERQRSEELLPPYVSSMVDIYAMKLALEKDDAFILHKDIYNIEGQRMFFALMMSSKGVTIYCGTEE